MALDGDAVDLGSVRGAEVGDLDALRCGLDAGVAAGDLSVEAERDGARLPSDLDRAADWEGLPGEGAGGCDQLGSGGWGVGYGGLLDGGV